MSKIHMALLNKSKYSIDKYGSEPEKRQRQCPDKTVGGTLHHLHSIWAYPRCVEHLLGIGISI